MSKKEQALKMYAEGNLHRNDIARKLGVAKSTVYGWCDPASAEKLRKRKDSYRGTCEVCGKATDGSNGAEKAPTLCQECHEWPEEAIIVAMQDWAEAHGGLPPTGTQWQAASEDHPAATTVSKRMGWNEALLRAGFDLRCDRRPETTERMAQMIREGFSTEAIAEAYGCSENNVWQRIYRRGYKVTTLRKEAAA